MTTKLFGWYFGGTVREELRSRSPGEVVDYLVADESKRNGDTPGVEKEVRVGYRRMIAEVLNALRCLSAAKARSVGLISKCIAHKAMYKLQETPRFGEVNQDYLALLKLSGERGGLTGVVNQVGTALYKPATTEKVGVFCMAGTVASTISGYSAGVGVDGYMLVGIGFAKVFIDKPDACIAGIAKDLEGPVREFDIYLRDRAMLLKTFTEIAVLHLQDAEQDGCQFNTSVPWSGTEELLYAEVVSDNGAVGDHHIQKRVCR